MLLHDFKARSQLAWPPGWSLGQCPCARASATVPVPSENPPLSPHGKELKSPCHASGDRHRRELCCSSDLQAGWPETHISTNHQAPHSFAWAASHCLQQEPAVTHYHLQTPFTKSPASGAWAWQTAAPGHWLQQTGSPCLLWTSRKYSDPRAGRRGQAGSELCLPVCPG